MHAQIYIGIMSGTSLDGVDAVALLCDSEAASYRVLGMHSLPFSDELRQQCLQLQSPSENELHVAQCVSVTLADLYSESVWGLLKKLQLQPSDIHAVGVHGQTIRHRPELGFSVQLNQPARIAEQTGITVVSDFRARDLAAGGQGAPLVPAFHQAIWHDAQQTRVIANICGFANISVLSPQQDTFGFDTGPGNVLMDGWAQLHIGCHYDAGGSWAASGSVHQPLLRQFLSDSYFARPAPKSTGRDSFHMDWLSQHLADFADVSAADVQATLLELTAVSLCDSIRQYSPECQRIVIAGGGAFNSTLCTRIATLSGVTVVTSDTDGIAPSAVEGAAFAWFAYQTMAHRPSNLPAVTGARGARILGNVTWAM